MKITELADSVGTTPRMLRYYEAEGLLSPSRSTNGYRDYNHEDARTARQIVALTDAGLTLSAVRTVLPCASPEGTSLRACPMVVPALREQLTVIRERIETLNDSADAIEDYLAGLEPVETSTVTESP